MRRRFSNRRRGRGMRRRPSAFRSSRNVFAKRVGIRL